MTSAAIPRRGRFALVILSVHVFFVSSVFLVAGKGMAMTESSTGSAGVLQVGMGCRTMNPRLGLPLVGYPSARPNTGVSLDLCARAAVFASSDASAPQAGLVVLDTSGVSPDLRDEIRNAAAEAVPGLDADTVMVAATHTHSAVRIGRSDRPSGRSPAPDPEYCDQVVAAAAGAVADAWAARRPVRMRFGCGEAYLGHNRRVLDAEGNATNEWLDLEGKHTGYYNPDVPFAVFDDAETGAVHAILVSFGCHPVTLGPPNTEASADYPGYFVRKLEAETGAETVVFATGGGANINPRECLLGEPSAARRMGEALAAEVLRTMPDAELLDGLPVTSASVSLEFVLHPDAGGRYERRAFDSPDGKRVATEIQAIGVGDLVLISAPGELFAEIATAMRGASPFARTIAVGYANDRLGYLSTDEAQKQGGHEVRRPVSADIEKPLIEAARRAANAALAAGKD